MKIIVLHGDNVLVSYNRLQKFIDVAQSRGWKVQRADVSQNLGEVIVSDTLFQEKRLVIVEDCRLIVKSVLKLLKSKKEELDITLIIYHQGTLTKNFLKSLPQIDKVEEFKLPKLIWSFLESFYPGNSRTIIQVLHKIIEKDPVEFVFSLLSKQLRDLYWIKVEPRSLYYPSWRIGKLKRQASKYSENQLANLISEFAEIDIKSKTSQGQLIDLLDFIIATKLE
ncbi:hypothetical protein A2715_05970 [Candidatus Woesebacteria bacterium RIFCSPHIGHO2_01_FULL_39_32]|uniref:Polymerase III delta protein n=2 Tax=Candidatus Woeseibacteriota TaxID=1752722 RepID=A0A0G0SY45_9BACT|nr:MAG: polymerase III delta protein [Candidatus Woesebacteria bacterium GW2011_GWA1_39_8]OGM05651.1 MAG: hypothetical protein A2124_01415 [Candidatus Woesebacteria bacterium GWB1_37_5]OGM25563.1 MAG: hypothetical protein A2715_05970 [Candidatus Woesebacteria bacterium RIFCSPHIGHO2_01_FULL_39_32]OGM36843.1 MAG: hypothetical protein A3F01_00445 [Candidatus Woesebacteria bacterium RIFCSPHIGHO2_12_FULL_38_11]OGM65094.1 MAG: hypothetical protein A2893_05580 [Candidatus Woesebacteria bacterium RIFCS